MAASSTRVKPFWMGEIIVMGLRSLGTPRRLRTRTGRRATTGDGGAKVRERSRGTLGTASAGGVKATENQTGRDRSEDEGTGQPGAEGRARPRPANLAASFGPLFAPSHLSKTLESEICGV